MDHQSEVARVQCACKRIERERERESSECRLLAVNNGNFCALNLTVENEGNESAIFAHKSTCQINACKHQTVCML